MPNIFKEAEEISNTFFQQADDFIQKQKAYAYNMIYTLDYIKKEAENIASNWNGEDDKFMYDGDIYDQEHVALAEELQEKITEVEALIEALRI